MQPKIRHRITKIHSILKLQLQSRHIGGPAKTVTFIRGCSTTWPHQLDVHLIQPCTLHCMLQYKGMNFTERQGVLELLSGRHRKMVAQLVRSLRNRQKVCGTLNTIRPWIQLLLGQPWWQLRQEQLLRRFTRRRIITSILRRVQKPL